MIDTLISQYAKEGVFLALFLYLLFQTLTTNKETREGLKKDIEKLEEKHDDKLKRLHDQYRKDMSEMKEEAKRREEQLMQTLNHSIDKYDSLEGKIDEFMKEIKEGMRG